MYGRTAFVKEMVPTRLRSKSALSTSRGVSLIQENCPLAPLLTKISTLMKNKDSVKNLCLFQFEMTMHKIVFRRKIIYLNSPWNKTSQGKISDHEHVQLSHITWNSIPEHAQCANEKCLV